MNVLYGTIKAILTHETISLVDISCQGADISCTVFDSQVTAPYLAEGATVRVMFKEMETSLAIGGPFHHISIRNRLPGVVIAIIAGKILTRVRMQVGGQTLTALITCRSVQDLRLHVGKSAFVLIKATEITLAGMPA